MDAITLLKDDHKHVEGLFKQFERAGDRAYAQKRQIVDRIIEALSQHAAIEEQVFYPASRAAVPETTDHVLESLEEHHVVKWLLSELEGMDPEAERFDAKVTVLIENVRHHVEEEETEFFPKVRAELGRNDLNDLGDSMKAARGGAPTHPHPRSPDSPPFNAITGVMAGAVDKVNDTVSGVAQGGVAVAMDLAGKVFDLRKNVPGPTGSTRTRRKAEGVREAGELVVDGTQETVRAARNGAKKTVKSAKAGAKGTTTSARKATKRTATTARTATKRTAATARTATKRTAATARTATKRTAATAKRGATTTRKQASSTAKTTTRTAKKAAGKATAAAKR